MVVPEPVVFNAIDRDGRGLCLTFVWQTDRYAHTIAAFDGEQLLPLLSSRESTDREHWPLSPPLQTASTLQRPDAGSTALFMGMAGNSHWSVTVEREQRTPTLVVDVACRVLRMPDFLGSVYRMVNPIGYHEEERMPRHEPPDRGDRTTAEGRHQVSPGWHVEPLLVDGLAATLRATNTELRIQPPRFDGPMPRTVRWRYRVGHS